MNFNQIMKQMLVIAGQFGPLLSDEEVNRFRQRLLNSEEPIAVAAMILDIIESKPELPSNISREYFDGTAIDLLVELGEKPGVEDFLVKRLECPGSLTILLDTLALLAAQSAGPKLAALAQAQIGDQTLNSKELAKLISALGIIGGEEPLRALRTLDKRGGWPSEVAYELKISLGLKT